MNRTINFNAGPAGLPLPALERAQRELLDFEGTGMSIMEHSHRGKAYEGVHDEAISLTRKLLAVPDDYYVLFLQGGASLQFAQVPMNFLPAGKSADYIVTGGWAEKAFQEAQRVGADGVLKKPFVPPDPLIAMVKAALARAGVSLTANSEKAEKAVKKAADSAPPKPVEPPATAPVRVRWRCAPPTTSAPATWPSSRKR